MAEENKQDGKKIYYPQRQLSRKTAEPILFLAEKMAQSDNETVPRESRMIDMIADAVGMATFRHQPWYREMTQEAAIARITTDMARKATMVVLTLVLKADSRRKAAENDYFTWLRNQIGAEPITVPVISDRDLAQCAIKVGKSKVISTPALGAPTRLPFRVAVLISLVC